ncbi:MAG TPA: translation elongation factor Ts [Actinomycetota bacterium]
MSGITAADVKKLRDETGAGMMDCKRALTEARGELEAARDLLRKWGMASAQKRASRVASEGAVEAYLHRSDPELPPRKGVLVELNCETDFVAKTPEFKELARDIAMHVAAMEPRWIAKADVPEDWIERERKIVLDSPQVAGKPPQIVDKIVEGKINAILADRGGVLLEQKFVKDETGKTTVGDLVQNLASSVRENVVVRRFARFAIGEETE